MEYQHEKIILFDNIDDSDKILWLYCHCTTLVTVDVDSESNLQKKSTTT